jgi:hypothetical protein
MKFTKQIPFYFWYSAVAFDHVKRISNKPLLIIQWSMVGNEMHFVELRYRSNIAVVIRLRLVLSTHYFERPFLNQFPNVA